LSGNFIHAHDQMDRRIRRTRDAIIGAFKSIVFQTRYNDIRVSDIANKADIGRSTFYEHFAGKDDLLVSSMNWVLVGLAESAKPGADLATVFEVLDHIWENRSKGRTILSGQSGDRFTKALASKFEAGLKQLLEAEKTEFLLPPVFTANQLAASTMSLLKTWLSGTAPASAEAMAKALTRSSKAIIEAAISEREG